MDPEIKRQLEEIHALVKDNHQMLRAMRRDAWLGFFARIIFWVIIIVAPLYFLQQYLQPLMDNLSVLSSIPGVTGTNLPSSTEVQKLLESLKAAGN